MASVYVYNAVGENLFGNLNAKGCLRDIGIDGKSVLNVDLKINRLYVY